MLAICILTLSAGLVFTIWSAYQSEPDPGPQRFRFEPSYYKDPEAMRKLPEAGE